MNRFFATACFSACFLFFAACRPAAITNQKSYSLPLEQIQSAQYDIVMNSGILVLNSGTQNLFDLDATTPGILSDPQINYRKNGSNALVSIEQSLPGSSLRRNTTEWELRLPSEVPASINLNLGPGIHNLAIGGLQVSRLQVDQQGAAVILLDLAGFWEEDIEILINGSKGSALTITAPQGTDTRVEIHGRVQKVDPGNFKRDLNGYTNAAAPGTGAQLTIRLEGNLSNLSLSSGFPRDMPVHVALQLARSMFSQQEVFDCSTEPQDRLPLPSDTVKELWLDYLCHRGPEHRMLDGSTTLTHDLARSELVDQIRRQFYSGEPLDEATLYFNIPEFLSATVDMLTMMQELQRYEFSITHFIGSFDYSVIREGDRIRYVVHNQTDRSSGTHIPLRFPEGGYTLSLEELVRQKPTLANAFMLEVIHSGKFPIVSILEAKSRSDMLPGEGGGNFTQTFTWTEQDLNLTELPPWPTYLDQIDIK
jgi:hypothetical protein